MKLLTTHPYAETGCLAVGVYLTSSNHKLSFDFYRIITRGQGIEIWEAYKPLNSFQSSHRLNPDGTNLRL